MSHGKSTMNPAIHLLVLTVFIDLIGFGIIIPLLPLYAETFHATARTIGFLMATFSFWQFIFAPILGRWSDRVGRRPVLLLSLAGTVIGYIPLAIADKFTHPVFAAVPLGLVLLFLSRTLDGISGGNISTAQAYIADITTPEDRIKGMAMIGAAFGLGFIFGPVIGSWLVRYGFHWPAVAAATLAIINWIWAYKALPESWTPEAKPAGRTFSLNSIAKNLAKPEIGKLIVLVFVATFAFANFETTFVLYLQHQLEHAVTSGAAKAAAEKSGPYFAYVGFLMALIQGGAIRRFRGKNLEPVLIAGGTLSLAIGLLGLALIQSSSLCLIPLAFMAFGSGFVNPSLTSLVSQRSNPNEIGETLGATQGMSGLARIIGPAVAGWLFGIHVSLPYFVAAVVMGLAFLIALSLKKASKPAKAVAATT